MGALAAIKENNSTPNFSLVKSQPAEVSRIDKIKDKPLNNKQKLKRDEKWLFCKMVVDIKTQKRTSWDDAVHIIVINHADKFPILTTSGQKGASQLTKFNCKRWLGHLGKKNNDYNWENKNALVDNYVSGIQKYAGDEAFWQLFRAFYFNQVKLSIAEAYRLTVMKKRKEDPLSFVPTLRQVRYQVQRFDPVATALARHGEEYVKNNFLSYINRDWSDVLSNEIWISDHRQFDSAIKVQDEEGKWKAVRPWLCGFMDAKSWYMTSYQVTAESPNSETIRNGLGWGIHLHGKPAYFYTDNGKDFKAAGFTSDVEFEEGSHSIIRELSIKQIKALPYNGRAKTIERCFLNIGSRFDKYFSSYLGNRPGMRPDAAGYFWKNPEHLPTLEEFTMAFDRWLTEYHNTPNNGKILGGKTPQEAFSNSERFTAAPMDQNELFRAFLLPLKQLRQVRRGPSVEVNKKVYYSKELWPYFGQKLLIKIDRLDLEHVFVFKPNGEPICECKTKQAIKALALTDEDRKLISEGMAEQRRDMKRGYTILKNSTGDLHLLDVQSILALPADFKIQKVGEMRSVKGANHKFKHFIASPKGNKDNNDKPITFKEDKQQKALEEMQELKRGEEVITDSEDLKDFHNMIQNRRKAEDEYENGW